MPTGQLFGTSSLGGYFTQPYLTKRLRSVAQPEFRLRQFVDVREEIGKNSGDTFLFDKTSNVSTQGGTLVETATIPQTNFTVNQGTGKITEYGNSIPYTGKLEMLSEFQLPPLTEQKLRDDMVKVLESACGNEFTKTDFVAVCSATDNVIFTTNGTAVASATSNLTATNVRKIVDYMRKKLIRKWDAQNYMCVSSITASSGLYADAGTGGFVDIHKYTPEFAKVIVNGELGKYYQTRFVEETGYLSNAIGNSSAYGAAIFFGADNVYEAIANPEEIRVKTSVDYGRDQGLAWYALLGFQIVWNFAADGEQHIVYVTSA